MPSQGTDQSDPGLEQTLGTPDQSWATILYLLPTSEDSFEIDTIKAGESEFIIFPTII